MDCMFLEKTWELRTVLYPHRPGSHSLSLGHPTFFYRPQVCIQKIFQELSHKAFSHGCLCQHSCIGSWGWGGGCKWRWRIEANLYWTSCVFTLCMCMFVLHQHISEEWTWSCQNDIVCRNQLIILTHQGHICKVNVLHQRSAYRNLSKSSTSLAGIFAV